MAIKLPQAMASTPEQIRSGHLSDLQRTRNKLHRFLNKHKIEINEPQFVKGVFPLPQKKEAEARFVEFKNAWCELAEVKFSQAGWHDGFYDYFIRGTIDPIQPQKLTVSKTTLGPPLLESLFG